MPAKFMLLVVSSDVLLLCFWRLDSDLGFPVTRKII